MKTKIRKFKETDLETVLDIDREFPPTSRGLITKDDAVRLSKQSPKTCLVAEKGGKVIGFIFGELGEDSCVVRFLQVLPEYLGEGIVTDLIDEVEKLTNARVLLKGK
ncbi:MAG: GNAT family N-acetyltransferase [Methanocellales archaeon]|nr:GNAT family N-acetyltransferase [Methanocellales archaeon]